MSDAVPAWACEEAEVLPYEPRLAERARTERDGLARLLAAWLVDGVKRVGCASCFGKQGGQRREPAPGQLQPPVIFEHGK